ncbi:lipase [Trichophyton equinum CBS 127.97]|uniref:Patatin-like phospholipase domain-containing protein n=1 Tax=Trichophyton equinum (strain ATCC MYA-4606 / CBS 127.97) TaxID=559882 RepID=F2Q3K1_TRIEC|nr:lipase [Trichophyton equinum CBS 127.97]
MSTSTNPQSDEHKLRHHATTADGDANEPQNLPDYGTKFISSEHLEQFKKALDAPEALSLTAVNDWRPINQRVRKPANGRKLRRRRKDETREGFVYTLLKWPFLIFVLTWIAVLSFCYLLTRFYILFYENLFSWKGKRRKLRKTLRSTEEYERWKDVAKELDTFLGNDVWKEDDEYAYYNHVTVNAVVTQLQDLRARIQIATDEGRKPEKEHAIEELRALLEACIKNNFAGVENPRLYSETYFGTKHLVQQFIDEAEASLRILLESGSLQDHDKALFFKHLDTNFGRTALCLSGGATFAYYHFGVVRALLDNGVLPDIISGTSGGALIAALVATRTDEELKQLLVPALAHKIKACRDGFSVWVRRWWLTGARFDTMDWAEQCSWFCRGSTTFREAYERTGRILNVSCVPSDPHSPTILANYLTSPNCVIWSAVIASAAVPGILNPVVLMMKKPDGTLSPYSFGHKWKDGSLRTDVPLKALDIHFNATFPIVSQVNPHISLFSFSTRGSVGRPVSHRKGRGWRGGFLGSAIEQFIKLDLTKWLKVLRRLELLPRPLGQDWSEVWLQRFGGTITIWPRSVLSDFYYILSDPSPERLAHMLHEGQSSTFPAIQFIKNRMKVENIIREGYLKYTSPDRNPKVADSGIRRRRVPTRSQSERVIGAAINGEQTVDLLSDQNVNGTYTSDEQYTTDEHPELDPKQIPSSTNRGDSGVIEELKRQSAVFFDDDDDDDDAATLSE